MDSNSFGLGAAILGVVIVILIMIGMLELSERSHIRFKDEAVERGYAEWVLPEGGRGNAIWQWVEEE